MESVIYYYTLHYEIKRGTHVSLVCLVEWSAFYLQTCSHMGIFEVCLDYWKSTEGKKEWQVSAEG